MSTINIFGIELAKASDVLSAWDATNRTTFAPRFPLQNGDKFLVEIRKAHYTTNDTIRLYLSVYEKSVDATDRITFEASSISFPEIAENFRKFFIQTLGSRDQFDNPLLNLILDHNFDWVKESRVSLIDSTAPIEIKVHKKVLKYGGGKRCDDGETNNEYSLQEGETFFYLIVKEGPFKGHKYWFKTTLEGGYEHTIETDNFEHLEETVRFSQILNSIIAH